MAKFINGLKACSQCDVRQTNEGFYAHKRKNGSTYYLGPCKKCRLLKLERESRARGVKKFIPRVPINGMLSCSVCLLSKPVADFRIEHGRYLGKCRPCDRLHDVHCSRKRGVKARNIKTKDGKRLCSICELWKDMSEYEAYGVRHSVRCRHCENYIRPKLRNYRISKQEHDEMMAVQNCEWCRRSFSEIKPNPRYKHHEVRCIDHCHASITPRAVLCNSCNTGNSDKASIIKAQALTAWRADGSQRWTPGLWKRLLQ